MHEKSITVERDGKHFIESGVEPGKVLEGPFNTPAEANARAVDRSKEFDQPSLSARDDDLGVDYLAERERALDQGPASRALNQMTMESVKDPSKVQEAGEPEAITQEDDQEAGQPRKSRPKPVEWQGVFDRVQKISGAIKAVPKDILGGALEAGPVLARGMVKGVGNIFALSDDMANWLNENVADLTIPVEKGSALDVNPAAELSKAAGEIAEAIPRPTTMTGGIVEFAGQWMSGSKVAKTVSTALGVPAKWYTNIVRDMAAGSVAMDPKADRLSNIIQEVAPNPLTEFLQARPDDTAAEGRLKNALEVGGLGLTVEGVMKGFRLLKASREVKTATAPEGAAPIDEASGVKRDYLPLGDRTNPLYEIKGIAPSKVVVAAQQAVGERQAKLAEITIARDKAKRSGQDTKGFTEEIESLKADIAKVIEKAEEVVGVSRAAAMTVAEKARFAKQADDFLSGNIPDNPLRLNLARIDGPEAFTKAMGDISKLLPEKGIVSNAETLAGARELGITVEQLQAGIQGKLFDAKQITAGRLLVRSMSEEAIGLAEVARNTAAPGDIFKAQKAIALTYGAMKSVTGQTTELARAVQAHHIIAKSEPDAVKAFRALLDESGGAESSLDLMEKIATLKDPAKVQALINEAAKGETRDKLSYIYMNLLVSNPASHAANITGNTASGAISIWERWLAGRIRTVIGGDGTQEGEALAELYGRTVATKDALIAAHRVLKTGENLFGAVKDIATPSSLRTGGVESGTASADWLKTLIPARWLGAEDAFFKWQYYRGELNAQAFRQASKEGLSGEKFAERVTELVGFPTDAMHETAIAAARKLTFNAPPGPVVQKLQQALRDMTLEVRPGVEIPVGKILVPFTSTPTNLFKWSYERAGPLALISRNVRADLSAGGARADMAMAKMATGTALLGVGMDLALTGTLTGGGPRDVGLRQNLSNTGWKPDSLRIGDKYYPVSRFDTPFQLMSIPANVLDIMTWAKDEDRDQLAQAITLAFAKAVTSKTYMRSIGGAIDAISAPEQYGEKFSEQLAGSFVPNLAANINRAFDPEVKAIYGMADAIRARTPGLSDDMPPKRDRWGRAIKVENAWMAIFSPIVPSTVKDSPIDSEMNRLRLATRSVDEHASFNGFAVELTPQEVDRYSVIQGQEVKFPNTGKNLYDSLNDVVEFRGPMGSQYQRLSDDGKAMMIRQFISSAREMARDLLLKENPELRSVVDNGRRSMGEAMKPGAPSSPASIDRQRALGGIRLPQ